MSLRSVGNQLLQTASSHLLDGATVASASFWIQVNPDNAVTDAGGVEVFGDSGGVFSATLLGTDLLRLQWTSVDAQSPVISTCTVGLVLGASYHVATTWQVGSQVYYLDGVPIEADAQGGTLGLAVGIANRRLQLGSNQPGTDVTLAHPTIWVGHALKPTEVVALRDGTAQPGSIVPNSIAVSWSLDGPAGAAAAVGDPGLADQSPNDLPLATIVGSAPTYLAGDLAYTPGPTFGKVTASPSGESLILTVQDAQGNPLNVTSIQGAQAVQTISVLGQPAGNAITLSFGTAKTTPLATTTLPPANYFLWTPPTTPGHLYSLAIYWWADFTNQSGLSSYFETIDGAATVATRLITSLPASDAFTDPDASSSFGLATWIPVTPGGGVTASGSSLDVRISSGSGQTSTVGALRVEDLTTSAVAYYTLQVDGTGQPVPTSDYAFAPSSGVWRGDSNPAFYGGVRYQGAGTQTYGPTTVIAPSGTTTAATLLQDALAAIPAIGPGNVVVADQSGNLSGLYRVTFEGTLAQSVVPVLSSSDPAVAVTVVAPGGEGFVLNRARGLSMPLADIVWSEQGGGPYIQLPLPQAKPPVQTWPVRTLPCVLSGGYWDGPDYSLSSSVSKNPLFGWSSGLSASFGAQWLPVGTYQWAVTWPHSPFTIGGGNYQPSAATQFLLTDSSGNTLATYTVDQTKAPADYTDADGTAWHVLGTSNVTTRDTTLTLAITTAGQSAAAPGQPQVVAILDAVQFTRTSADNSIVFEAGDSLSVTAGFVATASGPVAALVDAPIAATSPTAIMPAFESVPKTMKLGWGIGLNGYADDFMMFSNLAYLMDTMGTTTDANGYPTRVHSGSGTNTNIVVVRNPFRAGVGQPNQGATMTPPGKYILAYDGDPIFSFLSTPSMTITPLDVPRPSGAPANWTVFDIEFDVNVTNRPELFLKTQCVTHDPEDSTGTIYLVNLSNLMIYPPDPADPTGQTVWGLSPDGSTWTKPPKFWPHSTAKVHGANCLRFMNVLGTNDQPVFSFDFFKPDTHANRSGPTYSSTLPNGQPGRPVEVVSIRPATAADGPLWNLPGVGPVIVVETKGNSNFFDGAQFNFSGCGTASFSGAGYGSTVLDTASNPLGGFVIGVVDSTHLLCVIQWQPLGVMTNTVTGGYLLGEGFGTIWSLQDIVDLVVAAGPNCTRVHLNVPMPIDTSPGGALDQYAAFMAARLPSWVTELAIEPGNEVWNYQFTANHWATIKSMAYGLPTDAAPSTTNTVMFYARQGKAFHDAFDAAFVAARRPGVVRRLFGSQAYDPAVTAAILDQLRAIGAGTKFDEVCVALYISPHPLGETDADQSPIFNRMTTGQLLDYGELIAEYGGYPAGYVTNQLALFQQYDLPDAKVVGYEGSVSGLVPFDPPSAEGSPPGNTPDFSIRSHAAMRHPRMFGIMLRHAQTYQDAGAAAWCYFYLGGSTSNFPWACFASDTQPFGTGNPVTDSIGITNPGDPNNAPNQIAGALRTWANLVPTTVLKSILRNGKMKAIGLRRGLNPAR